MDVGWNAIWIMEFRKFSRRVTEIECQDVQLASRMNIGKGVTVEWI